MNVQVNQWVRWADGGFYYIETRQDRTIAMNGIELVAKVADTPQELIQVGDLVKTHNGIHNVIVWEFNNRKTIMIEVLQGRKYIPLSKLHITAIYTKDSQGNYIKQWEAKQ